MNIFVAHSLGLSFRATVYANTLEGQGHTVYVPGRDTNQSQPLYDILADNLIAIKACDECHVIWDGASQGTLVDLGSAMALEKPIHFIHVRNKLWSTFAQDNIGKTIRW